VQVKEILPQIPVGINAQKSFTQGDEAGNVQKRIWRELM
jgi:hypothetical protein